MLPVGLQQIASRHYTQSFSAQPVPHKIIYDILDGSRSLPTSANTQPWTIIVTQGSTCDQLSEKMVQLQVQGAPVHLIICAPQQCIAEGVDGIPIDMGTLLTSILLGAHSYGLGAKPQFSGAKYDAVCREVLGKEQLPDDLMIICGLSIGWPADGVDPRMTSGFPPMLGVDETTRWKTCDLNWISGNGGAAGNSGEQSLLELIKSRHCSHTLDTARPVPRDILVAILEAAQNAPSLNNTVPWRTTVIQGEARDKLSKSMLEYFDGGNDGKHTYKKYSTKNTAQMQKGQDIYGYELYEVRYGLDRNDKVARRQKYRPNYEFWGGPVMLLLTIPKSAVLGTWVDIGSFMYSILLGMHCYGLGGKPLGSTAKYTNVIQEVLGKEAMPDDEHLVCGLTIGWPCDGRDPRSTPDFFPSRLPLEETTRWVVDSAWSA